MDGYAKRPHNLKKLTLFDHLLLKMLKSYRGLPAPRRLLGFELETARARKLCGQRAH